MGAALPGYGFDLVNSKPVFFRTKSTSSASSGKARMFDFK